MRLPAVPIQPISAAEVAAEVAEVAGGEPLQGDQRHVVVDDTAGLFAPVKGDALIASAGAHLAPTRYRDWLSSH